MSMDQKEPELIDLAVSLTTSGRVLIQEGVSDTHVNMLVADLPVLVAEVRMPFPEITGSLRGKVGIAIISSVEKVYISSDIRRVFIGQDPDNEETGLVSYDDYDETEATNNFFRRWDETQSLIFEYTAIGINDKGKDIGIIACASGFYSQEIWKDLKLIPEPMITIREEK